ncbi:MAG: GNAT family N-acetyltransferase [Planctomycetota bacterium]
MINDASQPERNAELQAEHVSGDALFAAAMRIVPQSGNRRDLAARFLAGARSSNLDLTHAFAVLDTDSRGREPVARQACLAVPGPGRTAMLFLSGPQPHGQDGPQAGAERDACVRAAIASVRSAGVTLAQALPDPQDTWACSCFERVGMQSVGDLAYMSRRFVGSRPEPRPHLPAGIALRPPGDLRRPGDDRTRLCDLLAATYEGTLDCPELCGMRDVGDILESHLAAGSYEPRHWLIATQGGEDIGCCLVSLNDEGATAELVYIGLTPSARGKGTARWLLETSIWGLRTTAAQQMVCAVDKRNTPAATLYHGSGFREFASRRALVAPL